MKEAILNFQIDDPTSEFKFSDRLASENLWTKEYALECIEEYKRFMFLAALGNKVTPSVQVDEAWHLHILYTQSYRELCNIIGRFIDHGPTKGGKAEDDKYMEQYVSTLNLYSKEFERMPPRHIWPLTPERFAPQRYIRVDLLKHYIVPVGDKKALLKLLLK